MQRSVRRFIEVMYEIGHIAYVAEQNRKLRSKLIMSKVLRPKRWLGPDYRWPTLFKHDA